MPLLGWRKRRVGTLLDNPLVQADAAETILCATLAATTLLGLVLFMTLGWWWPTPSPPSLSPTSPSAKAAKPGTENWSATTDLAPGFPRGGTGEAALGCGTAGLRLTRLYSWSWPSPWHAPASVSPNCWLSCLWPTDLGMGQPMEHVLRQCLISLRRPSGWAG